MPKKKQMLKTIDPVTSNQTTFRLGPSLKFGIEDALEGLPLTNKQPLTKQQAKERWDFTEVDDPITFLNRAPNRLPFAQAMLLGLAKTFRANSVTSMYISACGYSGNYVKLSREYKCLPLLERKDLPPVFLYQFIEVIEGVVDYERVADEFPGLSYSQINGAFGFLRRISQFNTAGVDVDEVEQQHLAQDEELIAELRSAISKGQPTHVLTTG